MDVSEPIVKSLETRNGKVIVIFTDGHTAEFWESRKNPNGPINGLKSFCLFDRNQKKVVQYNGRPPSSSTARLAQHRFMQVTEGYTHKIILSYWDTVWTYVDKRHTREDRKPSSGYAAPWKILKAGLKDLKRIRSRRARIPFSIRT